VRKNHITGEVGEWFGVAQWLTFSPDGKVLVSANGDATIKLWDVETGKLLKSFEFTGWMWYVALTPDGRVLIAIGESDFFVWDLQQDREICREVGGSRKPGSMALSANGKVLAIYKGLEAGIAIYDVTRLIQGKGGAFISEK
jgi:WD40 repeat protein